MVRAPFSSVIVSVPDDAVADVVPVLTVRAARTAGRVPTGTTHENGVVELTFVISVRPLPEQAEPL